LESTTAYIGIGSNLGDKLFNCRCAVDRINQLRGCKVTGCSAVFKTKPEGVTGQDWFANCVAQIAVIQSPARLLKGLIHIESEMGRVRRKRWEARIIDLDILLFGQQVIESDNLIVPHPMLHKRRFVLEPLFQLAPELVHPVLNLSIRQLLHSLTRGPCVEVLHDLEIKDMPEA
jgi:2-amino-4-hydroxy-6-hydroxymethyldihydropteridine diphosphokinase